MLLILLWILASLTAATIGVFLGEKYGIGITIGIYASVIVAAQVLANKIVLFGDFTVPGGVIAYSISFLITDAIVEFYDKKKLDRQYGLGLLDRSYWWYLCSLPSHGAKLSHSRISTRR